MVNMRKSYDAKFRAKVALEAVIKRKDLILDEINRLIKKYGEDKVLY